MIIRKALIKDIPQIAQMKKLDDFLKYSRRIELTEKEEACYLVIDDNGQILGNVFLKYFGTEKDPDFPNIEDLFIRVDKRGQGLGTRLLKTCERLAKEKGFSKVSLSVNPILNPKAKALYERLGFKTIKGREKTLSGVYNGVEDWVEDMEKSLT
jgi:N-acetylglutamate synthase-like GNAT family acetyltransferase